MLVVVDSLSEKKNKKVRVTLMLLNRLIQLKYYYLSLPPKQQKKEKQKKEKQNTSQQRKKKHQKKNSNSVYLYTNKILKPIHKHQSSVRFQ